MFYGKLFIKKTNVRYEWPIIPSFKTQHNPKVCLVVNNSYRTENYTPDQASHLIFLLRLLFLLNIRGGNEKKPLDENLPCQCFRSSLLSCCKFRNSLLLYSSKFFKDLYRDIKCLATLCCTRSHIHNTYSRLKKDGFLVSFLQQITSLRSCERMYVVFI